MPQYRSLRGHNWPPGVRREAGEDVSDMPPSSLLLEIRDGTVEEYDPAAPALDPFATQPLPALPDDPAGVDPAEDL